MADSDSFFADDDSIDSLPGAPSEELMRDSAASFEDLDDVQGMDSDTPDAAISQEEIIAAAQEQDSAADDSVEEDAVAAVAASETTKKKGRFGLGKIDTSEMTIFDAILLISLILVSLATVLMFFELRTFGNFPFGGFPWRTPSF